MSTCGVVSQLESCYVEALDCNLLHHEGRLDIQLHQHCSIRVCPWCLSRTKSVTLRDSLFLGVRITLEAKSSWGRLSGKISSVSSPCSIKFWAIQCSHRKGHLAWLAKYLNQHLERSWQIQLLLSHERACLSLKTGAQICANNLNFLCNNA